MQKITIDIENFPRARLPGEPQPGPSFVAPTIAPVPDPEPQGWSEKFKSRREYTVLKKVVRVLQDNRMKGGDRETIQKFQEINQSESDTYPILKTILNVIFITTGMVLLISVIVVIIYTSLDSTGAASLLGGDFGDKEDVQHQSEDASSSSGLDDQGGSDSGGSHDGHAKNGQGGSGHAQPAGPNEGYFPSGGNAKPHPEGGHRPSGGGHPDSSESHPQRPHTGSGANGGAVSAGGDATGYVPPHDVVQGPSLPVVDGGVPGSSAGHKGGGRPGARKTVERCKMVPMVFEGENFVRHGRLCLQTPADDVNDGVT